MTNEEKSLSKPARSLDELKLIHSQVAASQRQCEITKEMVRQKVKEMQAFCEEARLFLIERAGAAK